MNQFQKKVLYGVPFVGPQHRARKGIEKQLLARTESTLDLWPNDNDIRDTFRVLATTIQKALKWPNAHFMPDDPFDIIFWDHTGDLALVELDNELTSSLKLPSDFSFLNLTNQGLCFIDVVNKVLECRGKSH